MPVQPSKSDLHSGRPILAQFHHGREILWTRHYVSIVNAIRRATEILVVDGEPLDVVEISHAVSGFQIGTVKLHVAGKMTIRWNILDGDEEEV